MKTILASVEATPSSVLSRPLNVTRLRPSYAAFTAWTPETMCDTPTHTHTLTLRCVLSADEGGVDVLEEDEALLRSHTQQVVQSVVSQPSLTQVQHTYTVLQLTSKSCTEVRICYGLSFIIIFCSHEAALATARRSIEQIASSVRYSCKQQTTILTSI